jgi:antitoxin component of MazEF toxin-antitoxin module
MTKTISKVGNSQGLIFDAALMELTRLKVGDQVNVEVHNGGTITLTPMQRSIEPAVATTVARRLIRKNSALFRRLA